MDHLVSEQLVCLIDDHLLKKYMKMQDDVQGIKKLIEEKTWHPQFTSKSTLTGFRLVLMMTLWSGPASLGGSLGSFSKPWALV